MLPSLSRQQPSTEPDIEALHGSSVVAKVAKTPRPSVSSDTDTIRQSCGESSCLDNRPNLCAVLE